MKHIIIGTAGHVDHGKTTLVKAMTGIDTDRLKEEKERGISIELGFAPLTLPSGQRAGLVDVPGHERFIKHMLAGVAGIDLVLLVIAADEGVMPQTREHLDIVELLQVKKGIVVITKKDLVDEDWLFLVEEEVREAVKDTFLADAPLIPVSAVTREGLPELLKLIDEIVADVPEKAAVGKARLPIDRVFSIAGFGTVVTGTLFSGELQVGDPVDVLPEGINTRVRTLQVHGKKVEQAAAGQRVAVNLAGVETVEIRRGSVVLEPNYLAPSYRVDAHLELLRHLESPLKNWTRIRFHQGTKETFGRVVILDRDELPPGESTYVQLVMEEPVVVAKQDRFVIRSYSPMITIGGGAVIDPNPPKQKRFREEVLQALATKEQGTPAELISQFLLSSKPPIVPVGQLKEKLDFSDEVINDAMTELIESGEIVIIKGDGGDNAIHRQSLGGWWSEVRTLLQEYHSEYPLRLGVSKEELRSKKFGAVSAKAFNALLQFWEDQGLLAVGGRYVALAGHRPEPQGKLAQALDQVMAKYEAGGWQPPDWSEAIQDCGLTAGESEELFNYCLEQGRLVKVSDDTCFAGGAIQEARERITGFLKEKGSIQIGEVRDILETSRRFVLPLMEYFDREKLTRRVGDKRILLK